MPLFETARDTGETAHARHTLQFRYRVADAFHKDPEEPGPPAEDPDGQAPGTGGLRTLGPQGIQRDPPEGGIRATPKGKDLKSLFETLHEWSDKHQPVEQAPRAGAQRGEGPSPPGK